MPERSPQLSLAEQVDAECDRYEAAFRAGLNPRMEAFLASVDGPARPSLFRALLELDIELRKWQRETPLVSDYDNRFPEDRSKIQAIFDEAAQAASLVSSVKLTGVETSQGPQVKAAPATSPAAMPKKLGRFEIRSVLGEGAFGTVYRARDPQLDRDVALKVPRFVGKQSREERERFLREARAAAGLHHAHICPVHEVGTIDGRDYIVLSFIDGKPLSKLLQTQPKLSERQIAAVIRKLALALQEAHDQGIIHRDLKPANIMINRKGEPVITDFGLARRENSGDAQISHSGQIMGTPAYMSPEQARGDGKVVGPASDIYGLGVILYELLCGRRPFEGTVTEVIGEVLHVEPPQPSQFRSEVDPRLQAICMRAIAKKPSDRYASMKEFATALADYARSTPREVRPAAPAVESGKELPTNQFADLLAAISSDVESKVERAVSKVGRVHHLPWWTYLVGSAVMGLIVLLGIFFFIRKDTVTVIVNIPMENINDPALSFLLDDKPIAATAFAAPIELKPGKHELVVNRNGKLFKRFVFDVGAKQTDPVVVQDVTNPGLTPEEVKEHLQGRWVAVAQARGGAPLSPEELRAEDKVLTITGDRFSIEYQLRKDQNARGKEAGRITRVDPSTAPAEIDMVFERGNNEPLPFKGIYQLRGDRLVHCYRKCHEENCERPQDFTTVKGQAIFLVEYQRAPAAEEPVPKVDDPDRKAAEQLLSLGRGFVKVNGHDRQIRQVSGLPTEPFRLTGAYFAEVKALDDNGLAVLKDCVHLTELDLRSTRVTEQGLEIFRGKTNFTSLGLAYLRVTDTGLEIFKDNKGLKSLFLHDTYMTDKGLSLFHDCKELDTLWVGGTPITDAGMLPFRECKFLKWLDVRATKVTREGVQTMKAALPACRVDTDPNKR